jgi:acyl-coenzyme A synthetase/AMP-(fatty) acid ligase
MEAVLLTPEIIEFGDSLPKTCSGKTDLRKLTGTMTEIAALSNIED